MDLTCLNTMPSAPHSITALVASAAHCTPLITTFPSLPHASRTHFRSSQHNPASMYPPIFLVNPAPISSFPAFAPGTMGVRMEDRSAALIFSSASRLPGTGASIVRKRVEMLWARAVERRERDWGRDLLA